MKNLTIYDLVLRLLQEEQAGNGNREFCIQSTCLNPVSVKIDECEKENKLIIKFRNQEEGAKCL